MTFAVAKVKHSFEWFQLPLSVTATGLGHITKLGYRRPCFISSFPKIFCLILGKWIHLSILQADWLLLPGVFEINMLTITGHLDSVGDKDLLSSKDSLPI